MMILTDILLVLQLRDRTEGDQSIAYYLDVLQYNLGWALPRS